ncbi:MAG: hypothetical protein HZA90_11040 [Verrucomicrobia bacterium]|nr:hypothetical protein [Verrucomicrobiota bacterium]
MANKVTGTLEIAGTVRCASPRRWTGAALAMAVFVTVLAGFSTVLASVAPARMHLACGPQNDLLLALKAAGAKVTRHEEPDRAVAAAAPGSGVLLLAEAYPGQPLQVSDETFRLAARKQLRLYVEFPASVPGVTFETTRRPEWERFVVSVETLGADLPKGRILMAHDFHLRPTRATAPLVVAARVAGYDAAVYGIPTAAKPVLFSLEDGRVWIATTKLSGFVSGRFAPAREWTALWSHILNHVSGGQWTRLKWEPVVVPAYAPDMRVPRSVEDRAFRAAVQWHFDSRLLLTEERWPEVRGVLLRGGELVSTPPARQPVGDGRFGILEGYTSQIQHDGQQFQRAPIRADCQAESAMVLALDRALHRTAHSGVVASNLLDFLYFTSDLCQGPRGNPAHPAFGLVGWGSTAPAWTIANYGDDNARVMMATMLAGAALRTDRWDEPLLRALLANLRTTGPLGFRGDRIDLAPLERHGWRHYHDTATVNYSPHFEAFNWACFLWAYRQTGQREFLDRARTGLRMMMEGFPAKWRWNDNGERAHMLPCLAWLVRLDDTPEHRRWLRQIADDLLAIQHSTGALPERFRGSAGSHYTIPASNEAYGTGETPLIQQNGDPVSDQLYVSGFVLFGLHEAAAVLDDPRIRAAEDKLADYLCRIQNRSQRLPHLSGTWFRAFDFGRWEPWASSADAGWGAWSVEAGWAQAWTAATLGLRARNTTFWDFTAAPRLREKLPRVQEQMARNTGGNWRTP